MNKRQLIVTWIMALLLSIGAIASTYEIVYRRGQTGPSILDEVEGGLFISSIHNPFSMLSNMIKYMFPVLIIGITLIYTLRNKNK